MTTLPYSYEKNTIFTMTEKYSLNRAGIDRPMKMGETPGGEGKKPLGNNMIVSQSGENIDA